MTLNLKSKQINDLLKKIPINLNSKLLHSKKEEEILILLREFEIYINDINTILTAKGEYNDEFFLSALLTDGFKGYENYTDDELIQEMNERDLWNNWFKDTE